MTRLQEAGLMGYHTHAIIDAQDRLSDALPLCVSLTADDTNYARALVQPLVDRGFEPVVAAPAVGVPVAVGTSIDDNTAYDDIDALAQRCAYSGQQARQQASDLLAQGRNVVAIGQAAAYWAPDGLNVRLYEPVQAQARRIYDAKNHMSTAQIDAYRKEAVSRTGALRRVVSKAFDCQHQGLSPYYLVINAGCTTAGFVSSSMLGYAATMHEMGLSLDEIRNGSCTLAGFQLAEGVIDALMMRTDLRHAHASGFSPGSESSYQVCVRSLQVGGTHGQQRRDMTKKLSSLLVQLACAVGDESFMRPGYDDEGAALLERIGMGLIDGIRAIDELFGESAGIEALYEAYDFVSDNPETLGLHNLDFDLEDWLAYALLVAADAQPDAVFSGSQGYGVMLRNRAGRAAEFRVVDVVVRAGKRYLVMLPSHARHSDAFGNQQPVLVMCVDSGSTMLGWETVQLCSGEAVHDVREVYGRFVSRCNHSNWFVEAGEWH